MSAGKTFTNAIIREIGRNYGKAISNKLMGNSHSTPVRVGGEAEVRGSRRKFESKLDEHLQKFSIKGKLATFNQAQNIHLEFFNFIESINADGKIDLEEFQQITQYIPRVTKTLDSIINALQEFKDTDNANVVIEKKSDILDFRDSLVQSFDQVVQEEMINIDNGSSYSKGYLLSCVSLDRIYYYPKEFKSYLPLLFFVGVFYVFSVGKPFSFELVIVALVVNIIFYGLIWNPMSKGGVWKMRKTIKSRKETFQILDRMLGQLKVV